MGSRGGARRLQLESGFSACARSFSVALVSGSSQARLSVVDVVLVALCAECCTWDAARSSLASIHSRGGVDADRRNSPRRLAGSMLGVRSLLWRAFLFYRLAGLQAPLPVLKRSSCIVPAPVWPRIAPTSLPVRTKGGRMPSLKLVFGVRLYGLHCGNMGCV